ncbi:ELMO/CED-12 family-domain-containing protein [Yarrowia lipolytica]|jgi:hypothetical protein|uniref:YALI0F19162p n=2 Tax=Yarrowia lipolytica TaxID=4952 RepID=Q6C153_YARLI|nr:YALI0F19162p [Yarrowia lipolytica CLIB122]AOW07410.1 hypothetical protein YALI1_F25570g [Yarrowia lipolytica]KAB8286472.1 ELMO/CED-12 family-domain-containing protein [Yarrowia lipolytica]KAE8173584.1 ELMO/CED-12 family-domain-containing protein [Yarrowia lipolytica]KAJ8055509.1 ELMO/CED-12 family-domain-containing protein [Yarrowia lipolytica]QNQ01049.1 ELMO domain-containing protein [Yarrowia lipolytica]|eukprot:XP_505609.1 YALI0F19162p [Yarrowia lipolytica CLIB122]
MVLGLDYLKNKVVGKGESYILGFIPNIFRYISLLWGYFQVHVLTTLANQKKWRILVVQNVARGSDPSTSSYEEKFFTVWNNWILLGLYRLINGSTTLFNTTQIDKAATAVISEYYYNFSPEKTRPFAESLYILNCEIILGRRVDMTAYFKKSVSDDSQLKGGFIPNEDSKNQLLNALVLYELPRYTGVSFDDRQEALELSLAIIGALNDTKIDLIKLSETPVTWATASKKLMDIPATAQKIPHQDVVKGAPSSKGEIQWENFGFQGKDPSTDFRGSGMLGLEAFRHFYLFDPAESTKLMTQSGATDPGETWYPPALISINVVSHLRDMLVAGQLDRGFILNINGELLKRIGTLAFHENDKKKQDYFFEIRGELDREFKEVFYRLHEHLVYKFHLFWKHGVQEKKIQSVLQTDNHLKIFLEKYDANLRRGDWK